MNTNPRKRGNTFTANLIVLALAAPIAAQQPAPTAAPAQAPAPNVSAIRRVCVEKFAGEESLVATVREIAIASLFSAKRFTVTEKCEKADAVLKGAVIERVDKKVRAEGEAADFGVAGGGASGTRHSGTTAFGAALGGSGESLYSAETGTRASVTLRLVNQDGDVVWAYTQDSAGGKTKGAVSDAVDRAINRLMRDLNRGSVRDEKSAEVGR